MERFANDSRRTYHSTSRLTDIQEQETRTVRRSLSENQVRRHEKATFTYHALSRYGVDQTEDIARR